MNLASMSRSSDLGGPPRSGLASAIVRKLSQTVNDESALGPNPPTVTVVIPCFNYARYVGQAIESALQQCGVSVDVVVVDDASTDRSAEVARSYAAKDTRVRVLIHALNAGPVKTFNDGLAVARGEFLVRLDADDLLTPGSLARSVQVLKAYPSVGLVYGHPLHFFKDVLPTPRTAPTAWTIWPGQTWLRDRCRDACNVITSPEVVMRASVVQKVGGQNELAHTHDMEMWFRIAAYSDVAYIHGADQAWHREHENSLSAREVDHYRDLLERREAFDTLFALVSDVLEDADSYRADAHMALSKHALALACRELDHGRDGDVRVGQFLNLALSIAPNLPNLPEWTAFQARLRMPAQIRRWHPASLFARLRRRLDHARSMRNWHRDGVFRDWPA